MNETPAPSFSEAQLDLIRNGVLKREATNDPVSIRGVNRIEIDVVDGLAYDARNLSEPAAVMHVGEPADRGGTGEGASPLSHFLVGAGACLLNQFIRVAVTERHPLRFNRAKVRGEFRRDAGGGIERIICEILAEGRIDDAAARALVERAERLCYVHVTLRRAIEMTTVLTVDGEERVRTVSSPAA